MMDETLKMLIVGYTDNKFNIPALIPPFKAHVNPASYTRSVFVRFSGLQAPGTSAPASKHNHTDAQNLRFEFLLDRTGALDNLSSGSDGVLPDITHFKKLVLDYDGKIHKPRYLILTWGSLLFKCQLQRLEVEHKMFSPQGVPLRAVLKATFREFVEESERVARENKSSPDLTHVRTVKEGDTLPLMTHQIYGDSKYYLEVARVNNLVNFRNLKQGSNIVFPPIEKLS